VDESNLENNIAAGNSSRPTENDIAAKAESLAETRSISTMGFEDAKMQIEEWAEGRGELAVRDRFYPGWTDEDFKELLNRLE